MKDIVSTLKILMLCAAILSMIAGCKKAEEKKAQPDIQSKKVLARVDGKPIYEGDVIRRIKVVHGAVDKSKIDPNMWQRMIESSTESEILDKLLLQEAISKGVEESSEEVDAALNRSKEMLGEDEFKAILKKRNSTEQEYREFLKERALIKKFKEELFKGITIDDDTLETYYEGHKESFSFPESVRLEMVIVDNIADANEIYSRTKKGEDIKKIVEEYSTEDKKATFRRTRWMHYDEIPLVIQSKVKSGNIGDIIEPTDSADKIYIVKILEKRSARVLTFEEAKEDIKNTFLRRGQQNILEKWYETAKQKVTIEYVKCNNKGFKDSVKKFKN
jgi:parvulin-like peptidyl-prolyl isomerase